jgi:hypothetical protein
VMERMLGAQLLQVQRDPHAVCRGTHQGRSHGLSHAWPNSTIYRFKMRVGIGGVKAHYRTPALAN